MTYDAAPGTWTPFPKSLVLAPLFSQVPGRFHIDSFHSRLFYNTGRYNWKVSVKEKKISGKRTVFICYACHLSLAAGDFKACHPIC